MISGLNRNKLYDSLIRLQGFPIDSTEIFETSDDLASYLRNEETAYVGQLVRVKDGQEVPTVYLIFKNIMVDQETLSDCVIRLLNYNDFVALQQSLDLEKQNRTQSVNQVAQNLTNFIAQVNEQSNHLTESQKTEIRTIILGSYWTKGDIERILGSYASTSYVDEKISEALSGGAGSTGNLVFRSDLEAALEDYYSKDSIDDLLADIEASQSTIEDRLTDIETETNKISDIETTLGGIDTALEGIQNRIGDIEDLTPGSSTLVSTIELMQDSIEDTAEEVSTLSDTVETHTTDISGLRSDLDDVMGAIEKIVTTNFTANAICRVSTIPRNARIDEVVIKITTVPSAFVENGNKTNDVFYAERTFAGGGTEIKIIISNQLDNEELIASENPYLIDTYDLLNINQNDKYSYQNLDLSLNYDTFCLDMSEYTGIAGTLTIKYHDNNI